MARKPRTRQRTPLMPAEVSHSPTGPHLNPFQNRESLKGVEASQETELRRTQRILNEVLQQTIQRYHFTPVHYVTLNSKGQIVSANLVFSDFLGMNLNLLHHHNFSRFLIQADHQNFSRYLRDIVDNGTSLACRLSVIRPDGTIVPVILQNLPHRDLRTSHHHCDFILKLLDRQAAFLTEGQAPSEAPPNNEWQPPNNLVDYPAQLRQVTRKLILSEHHQRRSFATQLHDFLGPRLTLCGFKVDQFKNLSRDESSSVLAKEILTLLEQSLTYTRKLITDLHSTVLTDFGLYAGLQWLVDKMKDHDLDVKLQIPKRHVKLPEEVGVLIFESVRELLLNVRKHAQVQSAVVSVKLKTSNRISVTVSDKGIGTDTSSLFPDPLHDHSFGLTMIRDRLHAFDGQLDITSRPGKGMQVCMTLQFPPPPRSFASTRHVNTHNR